MIHVWYIYHESRPWTHPRTLKTQDSDHQSDNRERVTFIVTWKHLNIAVFSLKTRMTQDEIVESKSPSGMIFPLKKHNPAISSYPSS